MSFATVRNNARGRFVENQLFLNYITSLEPTNPTDAVPAEANMMKGLFYVYLYASLERTINEIIETTLVFISSKSVQFKHFNPPFYSISLINKLKSFKDSGSNNFFSKALEIFNETSSVNICLINETILSNNLQNVWVKTVKEICDSFGIANFVITPRTRTTIDEIVDKRNAVAHGRESARVVGERFRTNIMRDKMNITVEFCNYLIDLFEDYYLRKNYLKSTAKRHYA